MYTPQNPRVHKQLPKPPTGEGKIEEKKHDSCNNNDAIKRINAEVCIHSTKIYTAHFYCTKRTVRTKCEKI